VSVLEKVEREVSILVTPSQELVRELQKMEEAVLE